ncbi:MAG: hypothetical protein KDA89_01895, partial [Planctomycetaceae bacterium]|nr:hypothetical protein [Planctomycetaceae bacterium]
MDTPTTQFVSAAEADYRQRLDGVRNALSRLRQRDRLFVRFRLATFALAILAGCMALGGSQTGFVPMLLLLSAFAVVVRLHQPTVRRLRRKHLAGIYFERCLDRIHGEWRAFPADGREFRDD